MDDPYVACHAVGMRALHDRSVSARRLLAVLLGVSLVALGCSDDGADDNADDGAASDAPATEAPATDELTTDEAAFAGPGPYEVGLTELSLPDREVVVFYPAAAGATSGVEPATYSQLDALPDDLAAAAPALLPEDVDPGVLTVTIDGVGVDVDASDDGPFPLVLFSHGFGSFRLDASALLTGIASWGFVVAAPQHIERDRAALVTNTVVREPETDVRVLIDTAYLVGDAGGVLEGLADTSRVGAVGHSAGGRAVLTALSEPEVDVAVGWAAAGRGDVEVVEKPSMNIAAVVDVLVPLEEVEATHDELAPPKRLVVIDGAGHNSFTDICASVQAGTDLIGLALEIGFPIPENLAAGATDGCEEGSIDVDLGWRITQHFTVAQLRHALGVDPDPIGLGPAVVDDFDAPIDYQLDLG